MREYIGRDQRESLENAQGKYLFYTSRNCSYGQTRKQLLPSTITQHSLTPDRASPQRKLSRYRSKL